ncbi:MAG: nuclear transport factor 2 family protein [Chloroflexota bacterium]|nr:nuclear transport factor 2 family protein [Chloroflexota bacterium]
MSLTGKGYYIWKVKFCENGDPDRIIALAKQANLSHVLVKVADGAFPYNIDNNTGFDYARAVVKKLQEANITVWGWHFVYGSYPDQEGEIAVKRTLELGLNGFVVDAESAYETPAKAPAASQYMNILRSNLGSIPIALSSFRYPSYHARFPWKNFLERCDYNMPQVYWIHAHNNAGEQLQRCVNEFKNLHPFRPIIPTGPAYKEHGWVPYESEIIEFMQVAKKLNLPAVNFWYWEGCRRDTPQFWELVKNFQYNASVQQASIPERYVSALNTRNPNNVIDLYADNAIHIQSDGAVQGRESILQMIDSMMNNYPNTNFTLLSQTHENNIYSFHWQGLNNEDTTVEGRNTIGLSNDKINFHYAYVKPVQI